MLVESFSGVRGEYNVYLTEDIAVRYAQAFFSLLKQEHESPVIVVGYDSRPSSAHLASLMSLQCEKVIAIGMVSTPMCEHAVRTHKAHGGIMITASHNEPADNGFKFLRSDGAVVSPESMQAIIARVHSDEEFSSDDAQVTVISSDKTLREYTNFLRETLGVARCTAIAENQPTIIIDPNGGAACLYPELLRGFGVNVIVKNGSPGIFARKIEPTAQSLAYLQPVVQEHGALFAAGFDCDADRVELVSAEKLVSGNEVLAIVVDEVLATCSVGQTVVTNDATSGVVREIVISHEATLIETEVGEIHVVDEMIAHDAVVGGEGSSSGGIVSPSRCRDGLHSILFILALCARKKASLSSVLSALPSYVNVRENLRIPAQHVDDAKRRFAEHFAMQGADVRIQFSVKAVYPDNTWVWMRASQTEAGVLRVLADAPSREQAQKLLLEAVNVIVSNSTT